MFHIYREAPELQAGKQSTPGAPPAGTQQTLGSWIIRWLKRCVACRRTTPIASSVWVCDACSFARPSGGPNIQIQSNRSCTVYGTQAPVS